MSEAKDSDVDRLTAIKELLDRCVRRPNEQYAYSRCEVCDTAFWDREEHRFGCKLLEWREALRDQSLSQEAVRDEVLEEAARVADEWGSLRTAKAIRALKREPNAAGQGLATAPPVTSGPAPAAPDVAEMVKRLREPRQGIHESGEEEMKTWQQLWEQCQEAAALLAKLGQGEVKATRSPYDANGLKEHPGD